MASIALRNRWEIFKVGGEEEEEDVEQKQVESYTTRVAVEKEEEEAAEGAWHVDTARTRSRRRRKTCHFDRLPHDVISMIFTHLDSTEILSSAQLVCSSWKDLLKQPHFFHSIDLRCLDLPNQWKNPYKKKHVVKLVRNAVARSCGGLAEFTMDDYYGEYDILNYVVGNSKLLRCLRLVRCGISEADVIGAVRKLPCLEVLDMSYCFCDITRDSIVEIGKSCPKLKCLRLDTDALCGSPGRSDDISFAIAENMPELIKLHFCGNPLTNEGLQAIVDGCPHLEYLDLRFCYGDWYLHTECLGRIKHLRLPEDSIDDYDYIETRNSFIHEHCECGSHYCWLQSRSRRRWHDEHEEDGEDSNEDYKNLVFLPPKAVSYYL